MHLFFFFTLSAGHFYQHESVTWNLEFGCGLAGYSQMMSQAAQRDTGSPTWAVSYLDWVGSTKTMKPPPDNNKHNHNTPVGSCLSTPEQLFVLIFI